jgi:hypothetical protein
LLFATALVAAAAPAAPKKIAPAERPRLVVLNFASTFDNGDLGQRAAYSLRAKLRRSDRFVIPDELDFDDMDAAGAARPALSDLAAAQHVAAQFGPRFLVWGEVAKDSEYRISVRVVDLGGDGQIQSFEKRPSDLRQFAIGCGELADEVAKALTGVGYREVFAAKSTEGYTRVSGDLVQNGGFEKGADSPDNWERPDGLSSFRDSDAEHGRFIRFDTDVYLSQWQDWRKRFDAGEPASSAPGKTVTSGHKYDTVAGTCGSHLYSDTIPVKPGATYSIEFDAKGLIAADFCFAKVFVKGYGKEGLTAELYNMYKAVRVDGSGKWQHFSRIFHPTERTPGVVNMRVMLFAYWPPGEYAFDNVAIYEVKPAGPAPPAPAPNPD